MKTEENWLRNWILLGIAGILVVALAVSVLMGIGAVWAKYRLWKVEYTGKTQEIRQSYNGKAILAEAIHARKARVEQAKAELESAEATAEAIRIVGEAAKQYPEYRQQEFYLSLGEALKSGRIQQVLYLPTEAGLPITEAGHR